ncbi:hypothetical protein CER19_24165 [Pseudomonas sp. GL93]|uniref:hypothetical protein n=1 Tax=unclassified Pseudomonas TaxID=196821 RepID=UPI000E31E20C|nr:MULTISPECIES: hypothetical protein [unclassified Pseudomonas]RFD25047.1 hypothetical protein CER19_24165 [Pseudomonas sp. GL93]
MSASHALLYTNEVSADFLSELDMPVFSEQQRSGFSEQALKIINERDAQNKAHPAIAIYRIATEGSQTRNGGVIKTTTSGIEFKLADGSRVRAAHKGDCVTYSDGTTAYIETSAGEPNSYLALVGSTLSNGDEIINTPQGLAVLIERKGVQKAEDFLVAVHK